MQTSIQQFDESLTSQLDTMNTILTHLDLHNQQVDNVQEHPPLQQHQCNQNFPPPQLQHPQHALPHQHNPQQQLRNRHQNPLEYDEDDQHHHIFLKHLRQHDNYNNH
ncbi:hypothetical protein N665_0431s0020 [Sinapis alba]|nr:hypothetical protein N665_0431s0020 [Sinapis alba]